MNNGRNGLFAPLVALLAMLLQHRAGSDFLRPLPVAAFLLRFLIDVLVLALFLTGPWRGPSRSEDPRRVDKSLTNARVRSEADRHDPP